MCLQKQNTWCCFLKFKITSQQMMMRQLCSAGFLYQAMEVAGRKKTQVFAFHTSDWICAADCGSMELSSPIGTATAFPGVKGNDSPSFGAGHQLPEICAGYSAGMLACLFQCKLGLHSVTLLLPAMP